MTPALDKILYEVRGSFWSSGRPLSSVETVRCWIDVCERLTTLRFAPLSVTLRLNVPGRGPLTIGDHSAKDAQGNPNRHLIAVDEAAGVLVDPALDMVRLKDITLDSLIVEDLAAHKGAAQFLKGHRELSLTHMSARLKYKAYPSDEGWKSAAWTEGSETFAPLVEGIVAKLS